MRIVRSPSLRLGHSALENDNAALFRDALHFDYARFFFFRFASDRSIEGFPRGPADRPIESVHREGTQKLPFRGTRIRHSGERLSICKSQR